MRKTFWYIQNAVTGFVWKTESPAEARLFAELDHSLAYNVYRGAGNGVPVSVYEIQV